MKKNVYIIISIFVVGFFLVSTLYVWGEKDKRIHVSKEQMSIDANFDDWPIYEDIQYGFRIQYPDGWEVREHVMEQGWQKRIMIIPKDLTAFPACQSEEDKLIESYQRYYDEKREESVRSAYEARSCGISINVEENSNRLSVKEFFEEAFAHNGVYYTFANDEEVLDFIESLKVLQNNNIEYVVSDTSFYYMNGFGETEGAEEEVFPALMHGKEQYIATSGDVIVFINNEMYEADITLPQNKDIFTTMIESVEFFSER